MMSDKVKVFICTLCEREWTTLPDDAVQLTTTKRGGNGLRTTYRFGGTIHVIKKKTVPSTEVTK